MESGVKEPGLETELVPGQMHCVVAVIKQSRDIEFTQAPKKSSSESATTVKRKRDPNDVPTLYADSEGSVWQIVGKVDKPRHEVAGIYTDPAIARQVCDYLNSSRYGYRVHRVGEKEA